MNNIRLGRRKGTRLVADRYLTVLLLLSFLGVPAALEAQFNYITANGTATITGYTGPGGSVTIPDTINGLPVTSIGEYAFAACNNLTSVNMPTSVTTIAEFAFASCRSLTSLRIPDNVSSIGGGAFYDCAMLTNVVIGNGVTSIKSLWWGFYAYGAFAGCSKLTGVYFQGNAPRKIGLGYVFEGDPVIVHYLPGTTGWGTNFDGVPTALWCCPNPVILSRNSPRFGLQTNRFGFIISWAAMGPVVVEACTNLLNPMWSATATVPLTNGWAYFSDPSWANHPRRFYRVWRP